MVLKMILLLGFVNLVNHIARSILVRHMAFSELSAPSGGAHPEFSYMPLCQCKLQAVYCRERLHATVFGKMASLSLERASNYTKILYFEGVSKYFLYGAILGFVRSHGVSPMSYPSSIGFNVVKNTACLPLLRHSVNPFGNSTLSCNVGSIASSPACP